ncbi:MAG: DUF6496 domain-containing protein [Chromatiales bacterium]
MAKYGKEASEKVKKVMHERKAGTLKSGVGNRRSRSGRGPARRRQGAAQEIIVDAAAESERPENGSSAGTFTARRGLVEGGNLSRTVCAILCLNYLRETRRSYKQKIYSRGE